MLQEVLIPVLIYHAQILLMILFPDVQVCGPDLFATLIPMAAHEASSVYSEQKAQLLRRLSKIVEDKNADLASYESSLNISKEDLLSMMVSLLSIMLSLQCLENIE